MGRHGKRKGNKGIGENFSRNNFLVTALATAEVLFWTFENLYSPSGIVYKKRKETILSTCVTQLNFFTHLANGKLHSVSLYTNNNNVTFTDGFNERPCHSPSRHFVP